MTELPVGLWIGWPIPVLAHAVPGTWTFDPLVVAGVVAMAAVYLTAVRQVRLLSGRPFPPGRVAMFLAGLVVLFVALESPIDTEADNLLSVHMVQHLLLTMVAVPLLILGDPIRLALQASSRATRRRILVPALRSRPARILGSPILGWSVFAVVMWGIHATPIYEAALRSTSVHAAEHLALLVAATLFWWPILGRDPNPRMSHPARLLYMFLAMPVTALLGLAIMSSGRVLYPHYAHTALALGISALSDQRLAGVLMWASGMFLMLPVLAYVLLDWMRRDEQQALRDDQRRARNRAGGQFPSGSPQGSSQVLDQVVGMLDADGQAHQRR